MKNTLNCGNVASVANTWWKKTLESVPMFAIGIVVFFSVVSAYGATNYVSSTSGDDSNTGADWDNAWLTLTNAVAQSASGDTVVLSNGVYTLGSQLTIDKALNVVGFGDDPEDVAITPETATRIDLLKLTHADASVENLTVRDGRRGIHLVGSGTVRGCIIRNCGYHRGHQGVNMENGGLVENSVIRDNTGSDGGAGVRMQGNSILRNCLVVDNRTITGNHIGGGVYASGTGPLIENCTIVHNEALLEGGGVYVLNSGGTTLRNSIVMFNRSPRGMNLANSPNVDNATILSPEYTSGGNTTRAVDPQFMDFENGDYRLRPGSPAIDTGVDAPWMSDATDLDGNPRLDGIVDVGAYEYTRGALEAGLHPAPRSGFPEVTEIVFTGAAEGLNTNGIIYTWDFNDDGTPDASGTDKAVVTNIYSTSGQKTVKLTITNNFSETAVYTFTNAVKIGPATVYVDKGSNSDTYPYASWSAAASNLQDAVDVAVDGSVVLVGASEYLLTSPITILDGITVESVAGAEATVIDGQDTVGCVVIDLPWFTFKEYQDAVLDGFTVTRGRALVGGIDMPLGGTVRNCVVTDNRSTGNGAGGIAAGTPGALIENCRLSVNRAGNYGAGAVQLSRNAVMRNSLLYGNWASTGGNGTAAVVFNRGGLVENCTIVGNRANSASGSGGLRATTGGIVRNSIVCFNTNIASSVSNDIRTGDMSSGSTHNLTGVLGGHVTGSTADPDFVEDGSGYGETHVAGDYRLKKDSPAVDEGSFQSWMMGAFDLDGKSRIYGVSVDIGAYEWHPPVGTLIIIQ